MAIHAAIRHSTHYVYDKSVRVSPQVIRLKPAPHSRTPILSYSLHIEPTNHFINWQQDPFGNYLARVVFPDKIEKFTIDVEVIADMISINPFDFFIEEYAEKFPFSYDKQLLKELSPYLEIKEKGPLLAEWIERNKGDRESHTTNYLVRLNQTLCDSIQYSVRLEAGVQDCETTLGRAIGSCRDSAWLLVQILRHLGLAARFVSGYLVQLKADDKPIDGPAGPDEDFTDLHAWAEVYVPGAGWIGLDPTSGLLAGEGHIPLAATPDYVSAAPITGFTDPCNLQFEYSNKVERIFESSRVTKPYSESEWNAILELGTDADRTLLAEDVRLTMGGEPTFVAMEDRDAPEWNDLADGGQKRLMALDLALKIKEEFAKGGFIHCGQGKWYPGEPLPRWQFGLYWRKDGKAIWKNSDLMANPGMEGKSGLEDGKKFILRLAQAMNLNPAFIQPCFEDLYFFMWENDKLPVTVHPEDLKDEDSSARIKLKEVLAKGLDNPAGYVLPMDYDIASKNWISGDWQFQRKNLFLIPGNSPIGLRLPLDSLSQPENETEDIILEASPMEELPELPDLEEIAKSRVQCKIQKPQAVITALCVEVRKGHLYVFLLPLKSVESYLELLIHIEHAAEALEIPVVIEGYHPPEDIRLEKLVVGPDPGVIEVNMQPAGTWKEIVNNYEKLFELAKACKLSPEKFMLDGRHTGTGGGNHITLGGTLPKDSPLIRRPTLLRSFVNFWQNHPGLSYLFSSNFVGPTSQAPRIDEGRQEILYEMEIAFKEAAKYENPPAWVVDRIFRNLLVDITGNTHRAEFCIDKLYNPDSQSGRLGILEMRGFDMPPHKEMCIVQILLIRILTACFWKNPYRQKLVRWGTQLHDKFLIHHFVKEDLKDVVDYMQESGFQFELSWLDSFFEFRFPIIGQVNVKDFQLTLRAGIEPWNVLGEEMSRTGTARFVDSSVERIEVALEGFNSDRYKLLCNQIEVPLTGTPTKGKFVAGIRYKAWNPPSSLHPTVGTDVPITIDIYDTWNERSIGGCVYHVAHPGGRHYDTFPVNSFEAEGRRISRFWDYNHSIRSNVNIQPQPYASTGQYRYAVPLGKPLQDIVVKTLSPSEEYPHTFDLRRGTK